MPRCFMSARSWSDARRLTHVGRVIDFAVAKAQRLRAEADRAEEISKRMAKLVDDDAEGNVDETPEWLELEKQLRACGEAPGRITL